MTTGGMQKNILNQDDMIFYKEDGKIMSGGFVVNSSLFESAIHGGSDDKKETSDLVVPFGLYYTPVEGFTGGKKPRYNYDASDEKDREEISDDIYEQLLNHHVEKSNVKPRKTRKHYKNSRPNKNTRRFHKKK